jgi:hypothetical protein
MPTMDRMYAPKPKCVDTDYIDFLIASPKAFCCTEAAAVQPESPEAPAHDAFTRLLHRPEPDPATLWDEARPMVDRKGGLLVLDDSPLDKLHARKIEMVTRHWSGKHKRVVWGINLITLVWTDGDRVVPATTSGWRSGRSCGWSTISTPRGSVGTRRRPGSSAVRSGRTSPNRCTT